MGAILSANQQSVVRNWGVIQTSVNRDGHANQVWRMYQSSRMVKERLIFHGKRLVAVFSSGSHVVMLDVVVAGVEDPSLVHASHPWHAWFRQQLRNSRE